jgi:hypothetical protein
VLEEEEEEERGHFKIFYIIQLLYFIGCIK